VKRAFIEFIHNVPFYGAAILCVDHPEVQAVIGNVLDRKVVTYGFSLQADICGVNVRPNEGGNTFDVIVRQRGEEDRRIEGVHLPMPGRHNVQNALAAIAVAIEMGCSDDVIREGFGSFSGVRRRFTKVGTIELEGEGEGGERGAGGAGGAGQVQVIDDYAHHPVEIRAVLSAAREAVSANSAGARVLAVAQPHRYTRLNDLMEDFQSCFNDADAVFITPVYEAGEDPIEGVDAAALVSGLKSRGHRSARTIGSLYELAATLAQEIEPGDIIVCLGAGDITRWAADLAGAIKAERGA
jgi:UDP-N-acetylmuramate--alanine ligase